MIITGFKIDQLLDQQNQFSLGISKGPESDRFPLRIKFADRHKISFERILLLKNNFSLLSGLDHELIPRAIDFRTDKSHVALITEYIPGKSVRQLTEQGPLDLQRSLEIALDLADIIEYLIQQNIIHQTISPNNVIISGDERAYLINFEKATNQAELEQEKVPVRLLPYELEYCAPEQTGRVNRLIDYRTDFYGLGMVLYQLLSGKKPFESDDPLELVHAQIARMPVPVRECSRDVPDTVCNIVQKLLAKNAEDRYQSAQGITEDLKKCLELVRSGQRPDFDIGANDRIDRFVVPQRLIGREKELATLFKSFQSVINGPAKLVLVGGYSGVGKSALIEEASNPVNEAGGLLVKGKADQFLSTPNGPLVDAARELFNFTLREDEHVIKFWKERIIREVGENLALLTVGLPGLDLIVGKQVLPEELSPTDAESRYNQVVFNFLQAIATPERPVAIFVDDLQWADQATLDTIEKVITLKAHSNLLFIGAFRNNEVSEDHPLSIMLSRIRESQGQIDEVNLMPLTRDHIFELVSEVLNSKAPEIHSLSEIVYNKTYGNPFFTIQLLKNLYDEKIVFYDKVQYRWVWDAESLDKLKISDNVIDLMLKKINTMPAETREVVCVASPIGSTFKLSTHAHLCGMSEREIIRHIFPAVEEKMLVLNSAWFPYMLNDKAHLDEREIEYLSTLTFSFIHDRVQQAAYSLIEESERKILHLKLGRILLEEEELGQRDHSNIYDVVYHLNQSSSLMTDPQEIIHLAGLNLKAGERSNRSNAFENSINYLEKGISLLPEDAWTRHYALAFQLYNELAWAQSITRSPEVSEITFKVLLDHAKSSSDRLVINTRRIGLFTKLGDFHSVIRETRSSLKEFGIRFPETKTALSLAAMKALISTTIRLKWRFRNWNQIEKLPITEDPLQIRINNLLIEAGVAAYSTSQELMVLTMLKVVNRSLSLGATESTPWSIQAYAVIASSFFKWYKDGFDISRASIALGERVSGGLQRSRLPFVHTSFITHWRQHLANDLDVFFDTYRKCKANGDMTMAYNSLIIHTLGILGAGYPLAEIQESINAKEKQLKGFEGFTGLYLMQMQQQFIKALTGQTEHPGTMEDGDFMEVAYLADEKSSGNSEAYFYNYNLQLCYYTRDYAKGEKLLEKVKESVPFVIGLYMVNELEFFSALFRLQLLREKQAKEPVKLHRKEVRRIMKLCKVWAANAPENFQHQYDLLLAEWSAYTGNKHRASEYYDKAIQGSSDQGFLHMHAICLEQAGRFYRQDKRKEISDSLIKRAWAAYETWGATGLKRTFQERYPDVSLYEVSEILTPAEDTIGQIPASNLEEILDFNSLLKSSQTLSGALKFEELLENMMQILMENAAAQRMAVILDEGGEYELTAYKDIDHEKATMVQRPIQEMAELIPVQIINYCFHTKELLVLESAIKNRLFEDDPYVEKGNILSVLCFPIQYQQQIIGLIYLENNLMEGAFTSERIEVLNLLSAQIAVSITNAQLYENLERKVEQRTREIRKAKEEIEVQKQEIEKEKEKSDNLLLNILPESIADELKISGKAQARKYDDVSVLFVDIVEFTLLAQQMKPEELVKELDHYFKAFDEITEKYGLEKIKTIGDAYMVAGGVPTPGKDYAVRVVMAALDMREFVAKEKQRREKAGLPYFETRFGVHTGSVVAGVVGHHKFAFDIWGDTVNTASRLQSSSERGKVNISDATYEKVKGKINCTYRGEIETKHKGKVKMYFVE